VTAKRFHQAVLVSDYVLNAAEVFNDDNEDDDVVSHLPRHNHSC